MERYKTIEIRDALRSLMGVNGDPFIKEVVDTGCLSKRSYDLITDNISYNGGESVVKYFGLIHWYYLQGIELEKARKLNKTPVVDMPESAIHDMEMDIEEEYYREEGYEYL